MLFPTTSSRSKSKKTRSLVILKKTSRRKKPPNSKISLLTSSYSFKFPFPSMIISKSGLKTSVWENPCCRRSDYRRFSRLSMQTTSISLFEHHALVSLLSFTYSVWRSHLRHPETQLATAKAEVRRDLISALHDSARHFFPPVSLAKSSAGFQNVISSILKTAGPSDSAKSSVYTKSQLAYRIYDGRYKAYESRTSVAPPIQLFHPTFGHFLDTISNVNFMPDDDMMCKCTEYMKAASAIYPDEKTRMRELTPLLGKILDVDI